MKIKNMQWLLLLLGILGYGWAEAHSLPDCKAQLLVQSEQVVIKFRSPYEILELASKAKIDLSSQESLEALKRYLVQHTHISDSLHSQWTITASTITTGQTTDPNIGTYPEIIAELYLKPDNSNSLHSFVLHSDWVIHQIPTQSILVSVEQDWANGIIENSGQQLGMIAWDIPSGKILPLQIQLEQGSWIKGFISMLKLGMTHIQEGTDHILFVVVLLLPCMLIPIGKRWSSYRGLKSSLLEILSLVTAFTVGHSLTLLLGALEWVRLPSQPVEVLIAVSILVSAVHAIFPVFSGKEKYIAIGFGLIHGLAFSSVLADLAVSAPILLVSILGFNLGIELMQFLLIAGIIPWLLLLSQTRIYIWVRLTGAILASIAAIGWIVERVSGQGNSITSVVDHLPDVALPIIPGLAFVSVISFLIQRLSFRRKHISAWD
ncbi:HupE/UreJ family protein [Xanthocytophaga flava]|uniref:HupE/UreJ family protein n=1 Tax=Xanthocytophaga flava TaxID=3048013 RepID=UPI0028D31083|nr:HupE/UreJ family protein [Xanthocytophaga flavus]MDJ1472734.1 HupE/UreJ family protein [Xanthocytophaga flavus]